MSNDIEHVEKQSALENMSIFHNMRKVNNC